MGGRDIGVRSFRLPSTFSEPLNLAVWTPYFGRAGFARDSSGSSTICLAVVIPKGPRKNAGSPGVNRRRSRSSAGKALDNHAKAGQDDH